MFQFYAGDLYEVFSTVQDKYYAVAVVSGDCASNYNRLSVNKGASIDTLFVFMHFDCNLSIDKDKVSEFSVDLNMTVAGHAG